MSQTKVSSGQLEGLLDTISPKSPTNSSEKPWLWKKGQSGNPAGGPKGWRSALKTMVGENGEKLWALILAHAEGRPLIPKLADGRMGAPIIPTAESSLRAAIELAHMFAGRPVDQSKIMEAEQASRDMADIRNLDDAELMKRARAVLEARLVGSGSTLSEAKRAESLESGDGRALAQGLQLQGPGQPDRLQGPPVKKE